MADTQTFVALNIGSQRIGLAVFELSKNGGLLLKAYDSESIIADPAMEASRIAQSRVAIGDLVSRLKIGKSKVRYAISGQAVFTRFVKLPPLQQDNLEQLVTFEAQQHVPFPLHEVVWDYELIEGAKEKEVVIVAIKGDALDEINSSVNDSGLATAEVDVAPMAIYNAFRSTYGAPEEPTLLIDIGAKTSNLLYIEGNRFFTRSIAIGGAAVTAAIAKEYRISFIEAEQQKVTNGLVALGGGHTEQLDEAVAALAMVIRNALTRLPAEIARTTNYYRSQHGGSAPRRILLAGGGANLPYTLEFFQEKLNLPVEYFNPVHNVVIGKGVDPAIIQRDGHLMGELVGLGLRSIGKSAINIDLVPAIVEQSRAEDRRKPFLIAAAAVLLLGCALWAVFQHMATGKANDKVRTISETRESLTPLHSQISGLLKKEEELRKIATSFTSVEADHAFWMDLLAEVRGAFASDAVWLTDLDPLIGYDPASKDPRVGAGTSVVKADFISAAYDSSAIAAIPAPAGNNQPPPKINAVRIIGFWRENPKSQNVVSDLLKNLQENSMNLQENSTLKLQVTDEKGVSTPLRVEQMLRKISVTGEAGELAFPFEIILPLAKEVSYN